MYNRNASMYACVSVSFFKTNSVRRPFYFDLFEKIRAYFFVF